MSGVLIVTGVEGMRNCAEVIQNRLGIGVEVAGGRKEALATLRRQDFDAVIVDETLTARDPAGADAIWEHAKLAIPVQVNFALSGAERLIREIRAALDRREREQAMARQAAAASLEAEVRSTLAGLLLHSQLALSAATDSSPITDRLRLMADLATNLREQLNSRTESASHAAPRPKPGRKGTPTSENGAQSARTIATLVSTS